jgi:ABC-type multidrug transport system fused ATPase/permease subunit
MQQLIDTNSKVFYSTFAASSWLSTMIQFLSLMMVIPVLFFSVFTGGFINAGFIAIALTNALSIGSTLQGIVQSYIAMEISLVSIERIKEYIDLPGEVESRSLLALPMPDEAWPSRGEIQFKNFSTGYRVDDPDECVLKNINLTIKAGSRVAVIGRTGSGKSTLVLSLFQLLQAKAGSIHIDGTDLASIDLATIRKRMAIIPQHSMIFPGTVRENLDPTKKASEKDLWRALKMVGLDGVVKMLTAPMQENGEDVEERMNPLDCRIPGDRLSSGEKQLFCFCRAILKKSQVVLLDEPTANIDVESDQRIQEMIRQVFSGSTVITIAHRLSTILDYDMVICLEGGRVVEYRNPQELLKDPKSMFYALYQASLAN